MNLLTWMLFGGLCGWVAYLLFPHITRISPLRAVALGVLGAFVGGTGTKFLAHIDISASGFDALSFLIALIGAILLLTIFYQLADRI